MTRRCCWAPALPMHNLRDFEQACLESSRIAAPQTNGPFEEEAEEVDDASLLLGASTPVSPMYNVSRNLRPHV